MNTIRYIIVVACFATAFSRSPVKELNEPEEKVSTKDDLQNYRLPTTVFPEHYDVMFTLDSEFGPKGTFKGSVTIVLKTYADVNEITLHAQYLEIYDENIFLFCTGISSNNLFESLTTATTYHTITINTTQTIPSGTTCTLNIHDYDGYLKDDMRGLYRSSYTNANGETEWLASSHFEPVRTRRAFPCFDDPKFKATFQAVIYHPPDYTAISNTPVISYETEGDYKKTTFNITPIMSSYLNAYVVSKFAYVETDFYKVYEREEAKDTANYTLYITPLLLKSLEEFTGIEYLSTGIGKLDQIAVPDFSSGAMENWGLITYRERNLLWDPVESSNSYKQAIANVIAHELSHMWFGNLVTCQWWSYTWLNEAFARYFQYHTTAEVETTWETDKQFLVAQHQVIFESDAQESALALTTEEVYTPDQISEMFGSITYSKGGSVVRMMSYIMGKDNFKAGLSQYLKDNKFTAATPAVLFNALTPYAGNESYYTGRTFTQVMTGWTEQAGFPVVDVKMSGGDAILTQKRFFLNSSLTSSSKWDIPITYTISHHPDFNTSIPSIWFPATSENITIENILHGGSGWVIVNIQETGYYRVNYDDTLWSALRDALKSEDFDGIHVLNRAQIVDDALNLARAGQLSYSTALDIVSYLENEVEYYPWYSAFNAFSTLYRRIRPDGELATYFKEYVERLVEKVLASVPFDDDRDDDQIYTFKKELVHTWACRLQIGDCAQKSLEAFLAFKENGTSINANMKSIVYCNALKQATGNKLTEYWNFLWSKYENTKLSTEENTILTALGCTTDEIQLHTYLLKVFTSDSDIRAQDVSTVFASVYANKEGVPVVYDFLKRHYNEFPTYYSSWGSLFGSVAERFTTQEELDDLEAFYKEYATELSDVSSNIESAIKTARSNLEWISTFEEQLSSGLRSSATSIAINIVLLNALLFAVYWMV